MPSTPPAAQTATATATARPSKFHRGSIALAALLLLGGGPAQAAVYTVSPGSSQTVTTAVTGLQSLTLQGGGTLFLTANGNAPLGAPPSPQAPCRSAMAAPPAPWPATS